MIRGALIASCVVGASCWTGPTPPAPGASPVHDRRQANTQFRIARVSTVRDCTPTGRSLLELRLSAPEQRELLVLEVPYPAGTALPKTFVEGTDAQISICAFHGCTASSVTLEAVALGVGARGHYRVEANAGPLYEDEFEATWVGTPWEVRACDYEMNPP